VPCVGHTIEGAPRYGEEAKGSRQETRDTQTRAQAGRRQSGHAINTLVVLVVIVLVLGGLYLYAQNNRQAALWPFLMQTFGALIAPAPSHCPRSLNRRRHHCRRSPNQRRHHCRRRLSPRQLRLHRLTQPEACSRPRRPQAPRRVVQRADLFSRLQPLKRSRPRPSLWCPRRTTSPRHVM
jgi:hypothetical protein